MGTLDMESADRLEAVDALTVSEHPVTFSSVVLGFLPDFDWIFFYIHFQVVDCLDFFPAGR